MAETYSESRLILCEGESDNALFVKLMERRGIGGFQVIAPAGGQDKFEARLRSLRGSPDFSQIKSLLIVTDNDNDPKAALRRITNQIGSATGYGVPRRRRTAKRAKDHPAIVLLTFPWDTRKGCLETVIVQAMSNRYAAARDCLNEFSRCAGTNAWDKSKRDKMMLRCMVSAVCYQDPVCSTTMMWKAEKGLQDLLDEGAFNQIVDFLRNFPVAP